MPPAYFSLILAIIAETIGTSALQASQQFTKPIPSIIVVVAYAVSFYFLAGALKAIPVGIAYAVWAGLGMVLIAIIGLVVFGQRLDLPAVLGLSMIIGGVLVIHLFSKSTGH